MLKSHQIFNIMDGVQKLVRYFYIVMVFLAIYITSSGYVTGTESWLDPTLRVLTSIEVFFIVVYLGIKVCKLVFRRVEGNLIGTEVNDVLAFWGWLESKIRDILVYNGMLGFVMMSLFL